MDLSGQKNKMATSNCKMRIIELTSVRTEETRKKKKPKQKKNGRHGAQNQHRHKSCVKWIVECFPKPNQKVKDCRESSSATTTTSTGSDDASNTMEKSGYWMLLVERAS